MNEPDATASEVFRLHRQDDLHFHMARVTARNVGAWRAFALAQRERAEGYRGDALAVLKADKGIKAFLPSLDCHDLPGTQVWVGFASDRPAADPDAPDDGSIEMFTSMLTCEPARFTGHMGITRSTTYRGARHAALACALHAFVARATLRACSGKVWMLTVAASRMREILVDALAARGARSALFIGDGESDVFLGHAKLDYRAKSLGALLDERRAMREDGADRADASLARWEANELSIALLLQQAMVDAGTVRAPVRMRRAPGDGWASFVLLDRDGSVLHELGPADMRAAFAWFFETPYFVKNPRQPLLTVDLRALAALGSFDGPLEHHVTPAPLT